tara:strand:+ start:606 stop:1685 length:1080 start_codon:yes stop_codon:yes gene_type:complete
MRAFNFGAGPATLPAEIMQQAQEECFDWLGLGMSVMEVSHRSPEFMALLDDTQLLLRELLGVPDDYHVLFLGAPTRFHFATVPMNFLKTSADYVVSGTWSKMAAEEAQKLGKVNIAASNADSDYLIAPQSALFNPEADYCFYTPNETLSGLTTSVLENRPNHVPLIADMTSCILSEPLTINDYSMIIAGAQKNLAPAGLSIAIIKQSFLDTIESTQLPSFFDYRIHSIKQSNYATPPVFNVYMTNLMLQWLKKQGGVAAIHQVNKEKAKRLYEAIDNSALYKSSILPVERSIMNVTFRLADESLNQRFLDDAKLAGLVALKGHSSMGGMRASIYNAMPLEGVDKLISFMTSFAKDVSHS